MGRIIASVRVENPARPETRIRCDALVDTGASQLVFEIPGGAPLEGNWCGEVRIGSEYRKSYVTSG